MFNPFRREDPQLKDAIAEVYKEMKPLTADSSEYEKMANRLKELNDLKNKGLDPNTVTVVFGNILIAVAVIKHEQTAVIATKLMPFLTNKM